MGKYEFFFVVIIGFIFVHVERCHFLHFGCYTARTRSVTHPGGPYLIQYDLYVGRERLSTFDRGVSLLM